MIGNLISITQKDYPECPSSYLVTIEFFPPGSRWVQGPDGHHEESWAANQEFYRHISQLGPGQYDVSIERGS